QWRSRPNRTTLARARICAPSSALGRAWSGSALRAAAPAGWRQWWTADNLIQLVQSSHLHFPIHPCFCKLAKQPARRPSVEHQLQHVDIEETAELASNLF